MAQYDSAIKNPNASYEPTSDFYNEIFISQELMNFLMVFIPFFPLFVFLIAPLGKWPRPATGREHCYHLLKNAAQVSFRKQNNPQWVNNQLQQMICKVDLQNKARSQPDWQVELLRWFAGNSLIEGRCNSEYVSCVKKPHMEPLASSKLSRSMGQTGCLTDTMSIIPFPIGECVRKVLAAVSVVMDIRVRGGAPLFFNRILTTLTCEHGEPKVKSRSG